MKASEARGLKVGDIVGATFGNYHHKDREDLAINWPEFTLRWKDSRGHLQVRTRRYRSICKVKKANTMRRDQLPSFLVYDKSGHGQ